MANERGTLRRRREAAEAAEAAGIPYERDNEALRRRRNPEETCTNGDVCLFFTVVPCTVTSIICLFLFSAALIAHRPAPPIDVEAVEADGMRWVHSADGTRVIEYGVCGDTDGTPIYFQHTYGGTGKIPLSEAHCKLWEEMHLRVISITMPGFGLSDAYPVGKIRTLKEWPSDVNQVLLKESVDEFYAMGTSAGCIHVAAIAAAYPSRILGVAFASPTAPKEVEDQISGISTATRVAKAMLRMEYVGDLLADFITNVVEPEDMMRYGTTDVGAAFDRLEREGKGHIVEHFLKDSRRAVKNTHRGWVDNIHVVMDDPPFNMTTVGKVAANGRRVVITTARDDTTNPPEFQKWFHAAIPGSTLLEFGEGYGHMHFAPMENFAKIVSSILL
mmetsp:Transcript_39381/g.76492  ORF Transcript_39381/g.76492 Transcript_39381/m.76492 type:complete len:388 (+) Transcript_39381:21-1184(+)